MKYSPCTETLGFKFYLTTDNHLLNIESNIKRNIKNAEESLENSRLRCLGPNSNYLGYSFVLKSASNLIRSTESLEELFKVKRQADEVSKIIRISLQLSSINQ